MHLLRCTYYSIMNVNNIAAKSIMNIRAVTIFSRLVRQLGISSLSSSIGHVSDIICIHTISTKNRTYVQWLCIYPDHDFLTPGGEGNVLPIWASYGEEVFEPPTTWFVKAILALPQFSFMICAYQTFSLFHKMIPQSPKFPFILTQSELSSTKLSEQRKIFLLPNTSMDYNWEKRRFVIVTIAHSPQCQVGYVNSASMNLERGDSR